MQNPFTTTFSKTPEYTYIHTEKTEEILENFVYENPSESVYKITGVRGSGKTVILAKVEEELKNNENRYINWLVFDVNPTRDILEQIAAMLVKAGFGSEEKKTTGINISATVLGSGGGIGYTADKSNHFFDIGVEVEEMIQNVQKKGKKILIGIDEVSKSEEMIKFASEYGRWLRAGYPVYFVCTGLYENIQELCNVKNLTFFRRATTVKTEPLNMIRMTEMYRSKLNIDVSIEVTDEVISLPMNTLDLCRIAGIFLDNAIEATLETAYPSIRFALINLDAEYIFIISNTFLDKGIPYATLAKPNVSTKGHNRGIGLYNAHEIISKYNHVFLDTEIQDKYFVQRLQVSKKNI